MHLRMRQQCVSTNIAQRSSCVSSSVRKMATAAPPGGSLSQLVRRNHSTRGLAIIITDDYEGTTVTPLPSTRIDGEIMKNAFERLGIYPIWKHNVTADELRALLETVTQLDLHLTEDGTINFVFSGHGDKDTILLHDAEIVIDDFVEVFSRRVLDRFGNVPKLFFIDACRGGNIAEPVMLQVRRSDSFKRCQLGSEPRTIAILPNSNVFMEFSTLDSYVAPDYENGSIWIKLLAYTICTSNDDIQAIATIVRGQLQVLPQIYPCVRMQLPQTKCSLIRKVYLNPAVCVCASCPKVYLVCASCAHMAPRRRSGYVIEVASPWITTLANALGRFFPN